MNNSLREIVISVAVLALAAIVTCLGCFGLPAMKIVNSGLTSRRVMSAIDFWKRISLCHRMGGQYHP